MPDVHDIGDDVDMSIVCLGIFVFFNIFLSLDILYSYILFYQVFLHFNLIICIFIQWFIFYYIFLKIILFIKNKNFIFAFKNIEIKIILKNALTKPINSPLWENIKIKENKIKKFKIWEPLH